MRDFITANERLSNPIKRKNINNTIFSAVLIGIIYCLLIHVTN